MLFYGVFRSLHPDRAAVSAQIGACKASAKGAVTAFTQEQQKQLVAVAADLRSLSLAEGNMRATVGSSLRQCESQMVSLNAAAAAERVQAPDLRQELNSRQRTLERTERVSTLQLNIQRWQLASELMALQFGSRKARLEQMEEQLKAQQKAGWPTRALKVVDAACRAVEQTLSAAQKTWQSLLSGLEQQYHAAYNEASTMCLAAEKREQDMFDELQKRPIQPGAEMAAALARLQQVRSLRAGERCNAGRFLLP